MPLCNSVNLAVLLDYVSDDTFNEYVTLWRWCKNETFKKMVRELLENLRSEVAYFMAAVRLDLCHRMYQLAQHDNPNIALKATSFLLNLKV